MSTSYYHLKKPFIYVRMESNKWHDRITLWTRHGKAGTLKIDKGDAELIARIIADNEVNEAPMYSYWDGEKGASVVVENQKDLSPRQILISEYGDILTVKKIRSRMGATE